MTLTVADMAASARQDGQVPPSEWSPRAGQPKRRTFTAAYKPEILQQYEQGHGSQSPFASMCGPSWPCTVETRGKAPASDKRPIVRPDPPYGAVLPGDDPKTGLRPCVEDPARDAGGAGLPLVQVGDKVPDGQPARRPEASGEVHDAAASESPALAYVIRQVTTVPDTALTRVSAGQPATALQAVPAAGPPLTIDGKPAIVFISEESCPFCAAERTGVPIGIPGASRDGWLRRVRAGSRPGQ